jgi:hypothetical protein
MKGQILTDHLFLLTFLYWWLYYVFKINVFENSKFSSLLVAFLNMMIINISDQSSFNFHSNNIFKGVTNKKGTYYFLVKFPLSNKIILENY